MNRIRSIAFFIFSVCLCGCSSLYYYPDNHIYVNPSRLPTQPAEIQIPARDGHLIPAWLFKTSHKPTKGVIVHFHGNAQNLTSHFFFLISAPQKGYDHLIFDYRGYGQSAGKPTPSNTVSDGMDVLRWTKEQHPETPMVVFGQSLGGAIALRAIIDSEIRPDAIIIDSAFASYRSAARRVLANHWLTWLLQPLGWLIVDNSKAPGKDIQKLPPTALLVVHGTSDQVVDFRLGKTIYELAPEPKEFLKVEGGNHTDFMTREQYQNRLYEFLEENLN